MSIQRKKSFSIAKSFTIILILVGIGLMPWYILQKNKSNFEKPTINTTSLISQTKKSAKANDRYFVIKEWGVQAPYNGTFTLTYKLSDGYLANGVTSKNTYIKITASQLDAADPECIGHGASVQKYLPTDIILPYNEPVSTFIKDTSITKSYAYINGYYFIASGEQMYCSTNDSANTIEAKLFNDVETITKNLEVTD